MRRNLLMLLLLGGLLSGAVIALAQTSDAEEQRKVAEKFITAYFLQNMDKVRECLPENRALMFSPYPLTSAPVFAGAKVDEKQALLEFTATAADSKFPKKGGVVFYRDDGAWRVRQVLFYDKVPVLFGLPTKSVTKADRAQEATVKKLGMDFMKQWEADNTKGMLALWYDWTHRGTKIIKGLSLSNFKASNSTTSWKDPYVPYTLRARYKIGPLSYAMDAKGGVILVKEGNAWKVRANHFVFDF